MEDTPKSKKEIMYRAPLVREEWPELFKKVIDEINEEQEGFTFQVSYDKQGNFYILESIDDFYVHIELQNNLLKIRNIFSIEKGNGYGKMIMQKIINVCIREKSFHINKIVADNVSPTDTAINFWKKLKFKWSSENSLNMEFELL